MTKAQAIHNYFSGFDLKAYPKESVPNNVKFPWLTYEVSTADFGDQVSVAIDLYYHTTSEKTPNDKAEEIGRAIGRGGKIIACDGGAIWIKKGTPWSISLTDENDAEIKRRQLSCTFEFLAE